MLSDLRYRLRALVRRAAMERELDDELRFHLEQETERHVRAGLSREEARRRAEQEFGGLDRIKEQAREARGVGWIDTALHDLRYAWRTLWARPAFAAGLVTTLGLGFAASTAVFDVADRLLFRPPAFLEDAGRVHRVYVSEVRDGVSRTEQELSYRLFRELSGSTRSFDAIAAFQTPLLPVGSGERTVETRIATVSGSLFGLFDADPVLGRFFGDAEDRPPEGERVAVLSHGFWRSAFGASPDVLGRSLQVGDAPYVIVGVAPRGFAGFSEAEAPALFVPVTAWAHGMAPDYASHHGWTWLEVVVKRRHGVSVEAANADLTVALARSREEQRRVDAGLPAPDAARLRAEAGPVQPGRGPLAGPEAGVVLWVMALALVVLVAACTNVVNLLLARSTERRREVAVRLALGVSRVRLLRQLATEGGLLAALGGTLGAVVGLWAARALGGLFLAGEVSTALAHPRSLLFAGATLPALVLATSLAPAVQAFRADASALLRHSPGGAHRSTVAGGLLIVQGTISVVLLVGAGLFLRSFLNARSLRLGYDLEAVLVADIRLRGTSLTEADAADLVGRVVDAATVVPGVAAATPAVSVPFWSTEGRGVPYVEGRDSLGRFGRFVLQAGSQDYFRTMGTRIVRGRGFTAADDAEAPPVAVVTRDMADALWPGADAVGREFRLGGVSAPLIRVVGIAEPMRGSGLLGAADLWYFLPFDQYTTHLGPPRGRVLVRADERADLVAEPLRRRLQQEMPGSAWASVTPLEDIVAPHRRAWRFGATMLAAFAALALALAAVGLYGMVAYAVALRRRELAVRVALGASAPSVVRQVVTRSVGCAAAGLALGGLIVVLAGPRVEPLLFGVSPRDPLVFAAVAGTLALVTVLSLVGPSLRALRGDPTLALRGE